MNLVGKIFVFLVFTMSLVFMTLAVFVYATHTNWRDEVVRTDVGGPNGEKGYEAQLDDLNAEFIKTENQRDALAEELAMERAAKRQQLAKLEAERERLLAEEGATNAKYIALVQLKDDAVQALGIAQQNLTKLSSEVDLLRTEIVNARTQVDENFRKVVARTDDIHGAMGQLRILEQRKDQLIVDLTKAERVLKSHGLSKDDVTDGTLPPVDGIILAVNMQKLLAEISIGSDDGLRKEHKMEVYRGSEHLGQVEVLQTTPDKAVVKINRDRLKKPFQKGDRVETRRSLNLAAG